MRPIAITDFTVITAAAAGRDATIAALREGASGLAPCRFDDFPYPTYTGEITALNETRLTGDWAPFDCRNNRLAFATLLQDDFIETVAAARETYGAHRIAVIAGTSTSGLLQSEIAYRHRDLASGVLPEDFDYTRTHNTYSLARFVRAVCGLAGPAAVISTACAATAKTFASAARMIEAGICDAALVGGADTLCATTLFGFQSLGVIAQDPCRPFDANRSGISIGEAAGFFLLERASARQDHSKIMLLGYGESADAYHMSSPHPEGAGALLAMQRALASAGIAPGQIDYINLHGTATPVGDIAEDHAVYALFGNATPCSSTKGVAGHTLGASGAVEAAFCALAIQHDFLPGSPHTNTPDPAFRSQFVTTGRSARQSRVISNSFGFGGANCSLVLGHPA